jgi:dihydroorotate dehydrogenase electron transfer subunit
MSAQDNKQVRGVFMAKVRSNRKIGPSFYKLLIEFSADGAEAFARCRPGQFAQFDLSGAALPPDEAIPADLADSAHRSALLRRPFSFSDVTVKNSVVFVEVLYCAVGPCSLRMTTLKAADSITAIGPLGTGFSIPEAKKTALLVVGGMGAGPLEHVAKVLTEERPDMQVQAFAGASSAEALPFERRLDEVSQGVGFSLAEFARFGIESQVATDDGSAGYRGLITDCFVEWLEQVHLEAKDAVIFACGPEAMLARIAELARNRNIDCQISMERRMACGIGVCQSCVVECRGENSETVYKLCCNDGPVFNSREVIFKP